MSLLARDTDSGENADIVYSLRDRHQEFLVTTDSHRSPARVRLAAVKLTEHISALVDTCPARRTRNKLQHVVNISSKITSFKQSSVTALYEKQVLRKANKIINDNTYILYNEYVLLPSSRRFRTIISKTNRKRDSFIPMSVRLLDDVCMLYVLFQVKNYNYNFNF